MLGRLMKAPINLFYDVTPSGKLISRFSEDLNIYRGELFHCIIGLAEMSLWIVGILSMVGSQATYVLLMLPVFIYMRKDSYMQAKTTFF